MHSIHLIIVQHWTKPHINEIKEELTICFTFAQYLKSYTLEKNVFLMIFNQLWDVYAIEGWFANPYQIHVLEGAFQKENQYLKTSTTRWNIKSCEEGPRKTMAHVGLMVKGNCCCTCTSLSSNKERHKIGYGPDVILSSWLWHQNQL